MIDPNFAKKQLDILTREWYMKPDGALPAYEWNFSGASLRVLLFVESQLIIAQTSTRPCTLGASVLRL